MAHPAWVLMQTVEEESVQVPRIRTAAPRLSPDRDHVREAIEILQAAERPMLMAGTSIKWSNAAPAMNRFISETHMPSFANGMGRGSVPPDSPEFLNRSRRDALKEIDGRWVPMEMRVTPAKTSGEYTELIYDSLKFDVKISPRTFSLQALKR